MMMRWPMTTTKGQWRKREPGGRKNGNSNSRSVDQVVKRCGVLEACSK